MTRTIDTILVPTDGSTGARAGARRGIDLAARLGADLHILSVVDPRAIEPLIPTSDDSELDEREALFEEEAEQAVDAVADLANGRVAGELTKVVESGVPYQSITEYAESAGIDMIVMGTHGRTGLERALLGSVAEKTLRTASMPIVAVPPTANDTDDDALEFRYDDVLLPTDGSGAAERAVEWGIALTTANDATLHSIYSVISSEMFDFADVTDIGDALEQIGNQALNTIRERGERNDLTVETSLQRGAAAGTILSYAETNDVDMIVMGTHGRSGVTRYLIGSVTETVVRKAAVPVCCVPMDES